MKELSIEEKAKRYDEVIERLRSLHDDYDTVSTIIDVKEELENIFPELKESEDERIRKHLIGVVELYYGNTDEQEKKDCLAWLEKQGGQKPAELPKGEDYGIDGLYAAIDILQKTLGSVDGYQSDDGILEHKCAITAVKKLHEKKPTEWSEEDEKLLALSLNNLTELKDRFGEEYGRTGDCIEWLKSLKDRYTWKPTKEQMRALTFACVKNVDIDKSSIKALYDLKEQLKQL